VTPATVPGTPAIGSASSGIIGGTIDATARWTAPGSNGGSAITGYRVTAVPSAGGANTVVTVGPSTSLTMVLPAGNYRFMVAAINAVGTGANSGLSTLVTAR